MTKITIEWTHGCPREGAEQDEARAAVAAEKALESIDPEEAQAAYDRHMSDEEYNRTPREMILIAAWEAAQRAADLALTEGWHDPDGASCVIRAG